VKVLRSISVLYLLILLSCNQKQIEQEVKSSNGTIIPVPFNKVYLEDQFWSERLETQSQVLLPFALDKVQPAIENLQKAANFLKGIEDELPFPHRYISSDLYKVMEGAAYLLMENRDPELEKQLDEIIAIIEGAQKEDGYLYVAHATGVGSAQKSMGDQPYSYVLHSHELYNMGHMYEAAIAYYQATGKERWLKVAEKNVQHLNRVFFEGDPAYNNGDPVNQAPGHQELELALVKLHRITGNKLYLEMAEKFLDIRGVTYVPEGEQYNSPTYAQQHLPVKDQIEAVGHAVRAMYMYTGMADVESVTGRNEYDEALTSIWHNLVDTKMHISGGLGAMHGIEGFGPSYELPNLDTYNETCAAVGNVLFNHRMFLRYGEAKYMDVAEIALLNNVLAGVNLEGNRFFYVNPLEADGITGFNHGEAGRSPWFDTACCPSNLARLIPQVPGLLYAKNDREIYVTFYAGNTTGISLEQGLVHIEQVTNYPLDQKIRIRIDPEQIMDFKLKLRIPGWTGDQFVPGDLYHYLNHLEQEIEIHLNGEKATNISLDKGFAVLDRTWKRGDEVELYLPMPVRYNVSHDSVAANRGRIAITRGPLLYCAEEVDNGEKVQNFKIGTADQEHLPVSYFNQGPLEKSPKINIPATTLNQPKVKRSLTMIPYYAWNNRGEGSMIVWLPGDD